MEQEKIEFPKYTYSYYWAKWLDICSSKKNRKNKLYIFIGYALIIVFNPIAVLIMFSGALTLWLALLLETNPC